jgi:hypothetical protein
MIEFWQLKCKGFVKKIENGNCCWRPIDGFLLLCKRFTCKYKYVYMFSVYSISRSFRLLK